MKFSTFKKRVVMTIGSLGDLHPYIALALEMKKRYIEPVIATSNSYRERIESLDIEFHPIRPTMPEPETPEYQKMMDGVVDPNRGAEYLFKQMLVPAYSRNARESGSRVRSEHGAAHAADLILDQLNERRSDRFRL